MEQMAWVFSGVVNTVLFLLGLSLVVTIHEAGHFSAARWAGVEVEAFAIGWGKVLWAWKPGKTEYRICLLPIGGYCKMKGEQDLIAALGRQDGAFEPSAGSLFAAKPWKKIVISAAGPLFNLAFAFLLFFTLQWTGVPDTTPASRIELAVEVDGRSGLPAELAGLKTGDQVTAIDTKPIRTFQALMETVSASKGKPMTWLVDRQGQGLTFTVAPRYDEKEKRLLVGVYAFVDPVVKDVEKNSTAALAGFRTGDRITAFNGNPVASKAVFDTLLGASKEHSDTVTVQRGGQELSLLLVPESDSGQKGIGLAFVYPTFPAQGLAPGPALVAGAIQTWSMFSAMVQGLGGLFTGKESPVQSLSGPIGMMKMSSQAAASAFAQSPEEGVTTVVRILAFINLALFLMNLLPIPALDGGSIVVSTVEAIRRRAISLKSLLRYQQVGVAVVLGLVLFTTLNDLGLFGKV